MSAVRALPGYRTFYLGNGKVVHSAQDSDTVTLCKRPVTSARIAWVPEVSCLQCVKVVTAVRDAEAAELEAEKAAEAEKVKHERAWDALVYTPDGQGYAEGTCEQCVWSAENNADDTSVEEGFKPRSERWYEVAVNTYSSAHDDHVSELDRQTYYSTQDTDVDDEMLETARRNDSSVTLTTSNRETSESYTYPKEKDTMAAKDTDELISDVHAKVDEIKALDPKAEDAKKKAFALYDDAEKIIRKLPTEKRNSLRADMRAARDAVVKTAESEPAPAAPAPAPSTAVVRQAEDPMQIEGIPDLINQSVKAFKDGVKYGLKLSEVGETVARTMLEMRLKMKHNASGLPDLLAIEKKTKNAAGLVYTGARKGVAEDDTKTNDAHDALAKATQNKMADILVGWLRDFSSSPNADEALETARLYFPDAAERVASAQHAKAAGEDVSDEHLNLTEAIYALYEEKGMELPRYGRTEIQRFNYRVKQLDKVRAELDAARDALDDEEVAKDDKTALEAKVTELEAKAKEITEEIPAEWTEKATPEKTPKQRAAEKVARATKLTESVGKALKKLEGAERQEVSTSLVALGRDLITKATAGADKLSDDEKADLKTQLNELVTSFAAEAAKL
ncbi:hypothetical protein QQY24_15720 [Streptomyces sp. TG1A-8]|uniref:hypothetical protein n=1 Tax=Streptomyces sp. TG1A-8 TaxID=3051385 RepID=UPI00265B9142|nr:hypothetical protein [Streptomyces sp. TG1A-8]MDO0926795.1 hypothetical protein [Streptomyces sp. TG1A-8]